MCMARSGGPQLASGHTSRAHQKLVVAHQATRTSAFLSWSSCVGRVASCYWWASHPPLRQKCYWFWRAITLVRLHVHTHWPSPFKHLLRMGWTWFWKCCSKSRLAQKTETWQRRAICVWSWVSESCQCSDGGSVTKEAKILLATRLDSSMYADPSNARKGSGLANVLLADVHFDILEACLKLMQGSSSSCAL